MRTGRAPALVTLLATLVLVTSAVAFAADETGVVETGVVVRIVANAVEESMAVEPSEPSATATILIAGDISSCAWTADSRTARLVAARKGIVMTVGDNAYPSGTKRQFRECYGPTWGRFRDRTRPVPGNHDYATKDAAPYFAYFGARAGPKGRGYYAFDAGAWRVYALDSDCYSGGRCKKGSAQYRWLKHDLAEQYRRCTMAVLHQPRYSSGPHGNSNVTRPLISLLYKAGVEVIVNGHDHIYERFAPARPRGRVDREFGFRQFIVGTGGGPLYRYRAGRPEHSRKRQRRTHGVLRLRLDADSYTWKFLPVKRGTFSDSGTTECHDAVGLATAGTSGA
jgi:hypothetical protein